MENFVQPVIFVCEFYLSLLKGGFGRLLNSNLIVLFVFVSQTQKYKWSIVRTLYSILDILLLTKMFC